VFPLDSVGRHVTDTLELSRAAATRHAHVSALRQHHQKAPRDRTGRQRQRRGVLPLIPADRDSGRSHRFSGTPGT
jgi:hypothetical protein